MLEEDVVIVWVEERLDSIWTVDCSNGNVLRDFVIKLENIVADIRILEPCSNSCALVEGCVL